MDREKQGLWLGLGSYVLWGFLSLFWKLLSGVPAYTIFSYRILFTLLTMLIYMLLSKRTALYRRQWRHLLDSKKSLGLMMLAALLISINWLVYIYAIASNQATAASLGYYVNPLISIVLAFLILKEKMSRLTIVSVTVACLGVLFLIINTGRLPSITLLLAGSFAFYGLIKKKVTLSSDVAMLVEATMIAPFAIYYLLVWDKGSFWTYSLGQQLLLALSGLITALPLLLFAEAVKRSPLSIIGFIQYINPTIQLLIALLIFGERVGSGEWLGFSLIWLAIVIFLFGQGLYLRKR